MRICVVGTGYVGLVAGTCFAECGNDVTCVDVIPEKVEALKRCEIPIYEPGLEELVRRNSEEHRLSFTTDLDSAVRASEICIIAVGTPMGRSGAADLSAVMAVAESIARAANEDKVVVIKSTVPVGTADRVRRVIEETGKHRLEVLSNPEFMKEGAAIDDFMKPDRVVIGGRDAAAIEKMKELYAPLVRTDNPILTMDNRSAEMTKYAANALLATRISFVNEIANLCEKVGADVGLVRRGIGHDRRIGHHFLFPGVGYGGSCFPKDVQAVIATAQDYQLDFTLLRAVEDVNDRQKRLLVGKVMEHFGGDVNGRRFAVWGLAFKPRTDDMREAPSVIIIERLLAAGAKIAVHDPEAMEEAKRVFGDRITYHRLNYDALEGADALLLVTEWNEFRRPDFDRMKKLLARPVVFDGRNVYEPEQMAAQGFTYYSVGRSPVRLG
ncbi:MAG: UDP-glucose/GDP-mannose dehydrogenase family protein [Deltaproteobacteria bacterium]|nr:UDP-glucose/GDP-mannose dehydrogenase family protein [Deltaproteobacteria bacterium]